MIRKQWIARSLFTLVAVAMLSSMSIAQKPTTPTKAAPMAQAAASAGD